MEITSLPAHSAENNRTRTLKAVFWILLVLAAAEFVVRGPVRYLKPTNWNDLTQYYASSRLWLRGQNFASPENFVNLWRDEVGSTLEATTTRTHIAPPPGALVLFAPIAALPWPAAKMAWLAVLLTGFALTLWSLARIAGLRLSEPRTIAFVAGCLALAPFHTGIAGGNQTIVIVGFCALGVWAAGRRHDVAAGLLFGAACSLKPHIASFLVLYYLIQRRWRLFATAVAFTAVLVLVAVGWMRLTGVSWAHDYFNNVRLGVTQNKIDDFTSSNPIRFMLINLQVPLYSFTHSARLANILALSAGGLLIGVWIFLVLRTRGQDSELLSLAAIAVIGLLPLYHRLYDASLLAFPLCWCASRPGAHLKNIAVAAMLPMAAFLIPGTALLQQLDRTGHLPAAWTQSWWWDRVVMPNQTWLLLSLSLILLYGMWLHNRNALTRPL